MPLKPKLDARILAAFDGGFDLERHLVCAGLMGSTSHNTFVSRVDPDSIDDVDIMGVVIPPPRFVVGLDRWEHWVGQKGELDVVLYSLQKFVGLLLKSNPNVLCLLWLQPQHYLHRDPTFNLLISERGIFSSKVAFDAFVGYARSQLEKMEAFAFQGYMGKKRKQLVARHGYDTKCAAHAIRLLRMGTEFLEDGVLKVYREEDAEELRAIKCGGWTLPQVKDEAERWFDRAGEARERSPLPEQADFKRADQLILDITISLWRELGEL